MVAAFEDERQRYPGGLSDEDRERLEQVVEWNREKAANNPVVDLVGFSDDSDDDGLRPGANPPDSWGL